MDLKIKDVAELLNVSETTIRRWLGEGKIPAYRLNHQYRFSRTEIESWVMRQRLAGNKEALDVIPPGKVETPSRKVSGGTHQFSLFRAIHKGGVLSPLKGANKEEAIRTAMKTFAKELNLDAEVMTDLLLDREQLQSTGVGNGIAIPHTRDYLLNTHTDIVVVAFPEKPLDYNALDGKPVHTLFFLFACDDRRHLNLLAKVAHFCNLPTTPNFLEERPSKEALLEAIKGWESSVEKVE